MTAQPRDVAEVLEEHRALVTYGHLDCKACPFTTRRGEHASREFAAHLASLLAAEGYPVTAAGLAAVKAERTVAYLGFAEGVVIPCGLLQFHDGPHIYHIEWEDR